MEPQPFRRPAVLVPRNDMTPLVRAIMAQAVAAQDRGVHPAEYAASQWPGDQDVPLLLRAAVTPTLMANATALTPITAAFVEALAPLSAGGALVNAGLSLTSIGRGLVTVPAFAAGEATFVGEAAPIPVRQLVASGPTLSPYKLASIVVLTQELLDHSNAEAMVRAALTESVALGIDRKLFSADAASASAPAGLLNGVAALTATAAGGNKNDVMATDLALLLNAIAPLAGAGAMIVTSAPQAIALQFRLGQRIPNVYASGALAAGTVIAIATRAFVSAIEPPRIDSSIEALVHMEDAPAAIGTAGSPAAVAAPARSLFQTATTGLRLITPVSWGLRAPGAVAWMSGVNW